MAYLLRLIQEYNPCDQAAFLALEAEFAELERSSASLPRDRRMQPVAAGEGVNVLIWDCTMGTWADVENALENLAADPKHTVRFEKRAPYIKTVRTEIFKMLEV